MDAISGAYRQDMESARAGRSVFVGQERQGNGVFPTADNGCSMSENRRAELAGAFQRGLDFCLQEFPRNETVQIRILASVFEQQRAPVKIQKLQF